VGELDGVWRVERVGGALPPLHGCVKRIAGGSGTTEFRRAPGMPFDVRGLELHYRGPFAPLVDKLERRDGEYFGRATLLGREFGQFTLRRLDTVGQLKEQLVKHIDEAHAMEQNVLRMLDGLIGTTKDPQMKRALERHKKQTEQQAERLEERLREHGSSPSKTKAAGGMMAALMKSVVDVARDDSPGRNARDGFATEHMEIASYEMLERVARKAKDRKTAAVARQNREEEEAMARSIASKWNKVVELSLKEEGVRT
jgi:ferritin-like metal-binding protein YciE